MRVMPTLLAMLFLSASGTMAQPGLCGMRPDDWCPSPAGDPCGRRKTKAACMADPQCEGLRYRGESVVACLFDARGFASNCPAVGCVSAKR